MISVPDTAGADALGRLSAFRRAWYECLDRRADALFELTDAVLCGDAPVASLAELSLVEVFRRGHGAVYDAVNAGQVGIERWRRALTGQVLPRDGRGRLRLAVDVSAWPRPNADTAAGRSMCYVPARGGAQLVAGWPYSMVVALGYGGSSWTGVLDAVRVTPGDDVTEVTATQVRGVVDQLRQAGQYRDGDAPILVAFDAGYDITRLAFLLADLPVILVARLKTNRVFYAPPVPNPARRGGRAARHGRPLDLDDPATHTDPVLATTGESDRYGRTSVTAWDQMHQKLQRQAAWRDHDGILPVLPGTVIRLAVDRLPGRRKTPPPMWLWASATDLDHDDVARLWRCYLRRFDIEHMFRFFKQVLGWTRPRPRDPATADRWTMMIITAYTQLRLACGLVGDLRRPWERPLPPERLTPARVRRGFRHLHRKLAQPANMPKPTRPGPGRPPGSRNKQLAPHPPVGKPKAPNQEQLPKVTAKG